MSKSDSYFRLRAGAALKVSVVAGVLEYARGPLFTMLFIGDMPDELVTSKLVVITRSEGSALLNMIELMPETRHCAMLHADDAFVAMPSLGRSRLVPCDSHL